MSNAEPETIHVDEPVFRRFRASLRISGDRLDTNELSRALGLTPTHTHRKGDPHAGGFRSNTIWIFEPAVDRTRPLDEHIMALWDAVRPNIPYLRELKQKFRVDIFCGYRSNSDNAGFVVDYRCLGLFAELEIPFGVSVVIS